MDFLCGARRSGRRIVFGAFVMDVDASKPALAYVADTMVDVRNIEGLSEHFLVTVVVPDSLGDGFANFWPPPGAPNVTVVRIRGSRFGAAMRTAWWLRRQDGIGVTFALDNLSAAFAANLGRLLGGPPVVVQVPRPTIDYLRCRRSERPWYVHWPLLAIARVLVGFNERRAAAVGAVSDYCAKQVRRHNDNVVSIAAYGVDTTVFSARWSKQEARQALHLPADSKLVMYRSRIAAEKDPVTFLRAISQLGRERDDLRAVYMGGEVEEMRAIADREGVPVDARRPRDMGEIPQWYVAADVVVQTSHAEGLGISPLEAMACRTPVVVSDVGGLSEVVAGGSAGMLVPPHDALATAEAIQRLLDDPALADEVSAAGRSWVKARYERSDTFARWAELGASAIAADRRKRRA